MYMSILPLYQILEYVLVTYIFALSGMRHRPVRWANKGHLRSLCSGQDLSRCQLCTRCLIYRDADVIK